MAKIYGLCGDTVVTNSKRQTTY